jgi:hypothetical protein
MTQKNTAQTANQTAKPRAGASTGTADTGTDAIVADVGINRGLDIDNPSQNLSEQPTTAQIDTLTIKSAKRPNPAVVAGNAGNAVTTLSPEVIELVAELRDTVRRINPSRHTPKTLRRVLSNVNDILRDISAGIDA